MGPCSSFVPLLALRREDLQPGEAEALSGHLQACPPCRERIRRIGAVNEGLDLAAPRLERPFLPRPRLRWPWAAAAAALFLAAWLSTRGREPAAPRPSAAVREEPIERLLGRTGRLALRDGGRIRMEGGTPALESGILFAESEEPLSLRAGGKAWMLSGSATFEVQASASAWISDAWAFEPSVRISVWSGELKGDGRTLKAGESFGPAPAPAWKGPAWTLIPVPSSLKDALLPLEGDPVEVLVLKTQDAELGVRIGGYEFPLGSALRSGVWTRLRIERRDGWCRVTAGDAEVVSCPVDRLGRTGQSVEGKGTALRAWGGTIALKEGRRR